MKVKDIVNLPKKKNEDQQYRVDIGEFNFGKKIGYNNCHDEFSDLPISKDKVIGMVEIDRDSLIAICKKLWNTHDGWVVMADTIIQSEILTIKGEN